MAHSEGEYKKKITFTLIGAGKLGTSVTIALNKRNVQPVNIVNRSLDKAKKLASLTGCINISTKLEKTGNSDFILVAVNDDSIPEILEEIKKTKLPVFHCSGSTPISVFPSEICYNGVFYPLQSFSPGRQVDLADVPVLIESSDKKTHELLKEIAVRISSRVLEVNSEERMSVHIAAVIASNFSTHMLILARDYLKNKDLPSDLINPLLTETFEKYLDQRIENIQTGPAVREDMKILEKHKELLKNEPLLQKIYTFVSESIIVYKKTKDKS